MSKIIFTTIALMITSTAFAGVTCENYVQFDTKLASKQVSEPVVEAKRNTLKEVCDYIDFSLKMSFGVIDQRLMRKNTSAKKKFSKIKRHAERVDCKLNSDLSFMGGKTSA